MKKLLAFLMIISTSTVFAQRVEKQNPSDFLPKGYVIFERINGDLNKDEIEDCILLIKGTDKSKIVIDKNRESLDRNRRGIIILFNKKDYYELAVGNYDCFTSENEDGGVYYAPELSVQIKKGNLYIRYLHGRYGFWQYIFRFRQPDFELIGYDESSNRGPIVNSETSINFLTKKKLIKENINEDPEQESGQEIFKIHSVSIRVDKPIKLSQVKDFDELSTAKY